MKLNKGTIIILNGTPRSGKSSIAFGIQSTFEGIWMNLGVDHFMKITPEHLLPGIGLRPGGEAPQLEKSIKMMYKAMFKMVAELSKTGFNVVVDVGIHDNYSQPLNVLNDCVDILEDYTVWFIGIECPIETIMERRIKTWGKGYHADGSIPKPIKLWQESVHKHKNYDMTIDTSIYSVEKCVELIKKNMIKSKVPTAFSSMK